MSRGTELSRLIKQQEKDAKSYKIRRRIINPTKKPLFYEIDNEDYRAIYILFKTGFSLRYLGKLYNKHHEEIYRIIESCATQL